MTELNEAYRIGRKKYLEKHRIRKPNSNLSEKTKFYKNPKAVKHPITQVAFLDFINTTPEDRKRNREVSKLGREFAREITEKYGSGILQIAEYSYNRGFFDALKIERGASLWEGKQNARSPKKEGARKNKRFKIGERKRKLGGGCDEEIERKTKTTA